MATVNRDFSVKSGLKVEGSTATVNGKNIITAGVVDAKGDLIVGSADDAVARLGVGTNGQVLTAASGAPLGIEWADSAGGGSTGAQGVQGTQGIQGVQGTQGIQGLFGPQGVITSATEPSSQSVLWMDTTATASPGGVATFVQSSAPTGIPAGTPYIWWQTIAPASYTLWIHDGV